MICQTKYTVDQGNEKLTRHQNALKVHCKQISCIVLEKGKARSFSASRAAARGKKIRTILPDLIRNIR